MKRHRFTRVVLFVAATIGLVFTVRAISPPRATEPHPGGQEPAGPESDPTFSPSAFRERVLALNLPEGLLTLDAPSRGRIERAMWPRREHNLSTLLHGLHLFGPRAVVPGADGKPDIAVLDLVLDAKRGKEYFGDPPPLIATRSGARYPTFQQFFLSREQAGTQAHPGQALSVLAGQNVPLTTPITLSDGSTASLSIVMDDLVANFVLNGEVYWDIAAVTLYLPPRTAWANKFGTRYTFDDLANELLSRRPGESACGGTHRLHSLTLLLRANRQCQLLTEPVRARVHEHLRLVVEVLTRTQRGEGYWELTWFEDLPGETRVGERVSHSDRSRLIATGHHLEWLMLLPPDMSPEPEVFRRGLLWLSHCLLKYADSAAWIQENYCPASHAARAVMLGATPRTPR